DNIDAVKIAIGLGATIFEKHVGVATDTVKLNAYSATPEQTGAWLAAAAEGFRMYGNHEERYAFTAEEAKSLRDLHPRAFVTREIKPGEKAVPADVFYAIPSSGDQIVANNMSKYIDFYATAPIAGNQPLAASNVRACDRRRHIYHIVGEVKKML